jgi:serine/alanine adding enzyme
MGPRKNSQVEVVRTLDEGQWREFIERHPQGNIFHTPEMFRVFECARYHRPELWAVVDCDGKPQALFTPVQLTLRNGVLSRLATRVVAYGSVLCEPGVKGEKALEGLLSAYRQTIASHVLFVELRNICDLRALEPVLETCGFSHEEHLDYLIDLNRSPDELLQSIGHRTRKNIRQGLKRGDLRVREVTDKRDIARCYTLIDKSYTAAGVPLADPSLFDAAFDVLYPRGMCKFWLASVNGTDVAASVELPYKDVIYGWYGGVDRRFSKYLPGELLMWHILTWGIENGYRVYDFGGAGKPGEKYGVRDFKAKFGGRLVAYGRNRFVPGPLRFKLFAASYDLYRRAAAFGGHLQEDLALRSSERGER